jgi:UPF0176 protein
MSQFVVAALYKFVELDHYESLKPLLLKICQDLEIKGTILLAQEGINGTIAGSREGVDRLLTYLRSDSRLSDLTHKESFAINPPFHRMKVNLKKEIVTMGMTEIDPTEVVGTYVKPKDWNHLIQDPNVIVVDTRNDYEFRVGTFKGSLNPKTTSFREFPGWVDDHLDKTKNTKVAMFCTGGIRCEKATSLLKTQGFEDVYHLEGGILKYLEEVNQDESLWEGECFVFDERVTVRHGLEPGEYELCHGCRSPITRDEMELDTYVPGVSCSHCYHTLSDDQKMRFAERHKQIQLAKLRNEPHIGRQYATKSSG